MKQYVEIVDIFARLAIKKMMMTHVASKGMQRSLF